MNFKHLTTIFFSFLLILSCSKDPVTPITPVSDYKFTGTINGTSVNFTHGVDGVANIYGSTGQSSSGNEYHSQILGFESNSLTNSIEVNFVKFHVTPMDCFKKLSVFNLGTYNYGNLQSYSTAMDGIVIEYYDNSGKVWKSDNGSGNQTGSSFSVSQLDDILVLGNIYGYIVKASFNCKLYDNLGNSITLTNGYIYGEIVSC